METSRLSSSKDSEAYLIYAVRPVQGGVKVMLIVAYDIHGIVLQHAVLQGLTANAAYYRNFLEHHIRPAIRRKRRYLKIHDSAGTRPRAR